MQSTAAWNEVSADRALVIVPKSGELTTSAAGISRSHDEMHSKRRGFDAAVAVFTLALRRPNQLELALEVT